MPRQLAQFDHNSLGFTEEKFMIQWSSGQLTIITLMPYKNQSRDNFFTYT